MKSLIKNRMPILVFLGLLYAGDESRIGTSGANQLLVPVGARGVGKATINSVVWSSISILAANYILTEALFNK